MILQKTSLIPFNFWFTIMYNLHKIILLYINEMFKLKINNSKPKDWSRIPLIIHNQMCYYEYMIPDVRQNSSVPNFECWGMIYRCEIFQVPWLFHDFWWFFKVPWLSVTFPENFIFFRFSRVSRPCGNPANFNGAAIEDCEWISNFIPHCIMDMITYERWD